MISTPGLMAFLASSLDGNFQSFHGNTDNPKFNFETNFILFDTAGKWGFGRNYGSDKVDWLGGAKGIGKHDTHGHLTWADRVTQ